MSSSSSSSNSPSAGQVTTDAGGLEPLRVLLDAAPGQLGGALPLPPVLARLYGPLAFPERGERPDRPHVFANFVSSLDGVVSLDTPGMGGGEISGFNAHDRMLMGLLRAVADAVVVGAGTLRAEPEHLWTAAYIYPPLAPAYAALRTALGKPPAPLTVIVTGRGEVDLGLPVFQSGASAVLIVTSKDGRRRIEGRGQIPPSVSVVGTGSAESAGRVTAREVLAGVQHYGARDRNTEHAMDRILVEGGPHLLTAFLAESCLDELFLTLSPQLVGREAHDERLALVEGKRFAPERGIWTRLLSVRQAGSHLFLRYAVAR